MIRQPILVIADDLTGAAEIAALGHLRGLRTAILLDLNTAWPTTAELIVIDSNSRHDSPELAATKLQRLAAQVPTALRAHVFKKVDSVFRGQIAAETEALAAGLGRKAILLCPCNPSRGRCIVNGRYLIDGTPLTQTSFATDPQHPAHSDQVVLLLSHAQLPLRAHPAEEAARAHLDAGIHIASAQNNSEIKAWVRRIDGSVLPAGGADFFDAFLSELGLVETVPALGCELSGAHLLLSGSLAPAGINFRNALADTGTPVVRLPIQQKDLKALDLCIENLLSSLAREGRAVAATSETAVSGLEMENWLNTCFSRTASQSHARQGFNHLLAEGGSTAVLAAAALDWRSFTVAGVWAGGVVTLSPDGAPSKRFTLKPGSYHWPRQLRQLLGSQT